jgi:oligoendopeptidase F
VSLSHDAVPAERTWDAESVFPSVAAWEAELESLLAGLARLDALRGRIADGPDALADALAARDELSRRNGIVFAYALLGYAVETTDQDAVARFGRAQSAEARVAAAASFIEPEVLDLGRERLLEWCDGDSRLGPYRHYLDDLVRRAGHTRSAEVEEVFGHLADPFGGPMAIYSALTDSDVEFERARTADGVDEDVTQGTIDAHLASPDRELRRAAWESYADGYLAVRNTLTASYASVVKQAVFAARVRRHETSLGAALFRSNVPADVFDNLIATFEANLPTWHRYWRLRRSILGVERLEPYDLAAPLADSTPSLDYEQCVDWVVSSVAPLGSEYAETVRRGCLEERWVDVYPTAGKMGGAFSAGTPGTRPFIVMSFDGTAVSLGTLAHELGHSMHSYLAWRTQPQVYTRYSMFVAEVASNFHQALLRAHLLETLDDPALQLAVLEEAMANFRRYFFIMPTLARFEREMHERVERGEGLTSDLLVGRMAELFAEGYGGEVEIERDRVGITWAQFAHLYEPFYVFQYATGISGAHALAQGVLASEDRAAERYLTFLSTGAAEYPLDALRAAGVDLSSPAPVEETFAVLASLVDRIETLLPDS